MTEQRLRPVVALDVDGVINAGGSPDRLGPGWELQRIEIPPYHPCLRVSPFSAVRPERGMALTVNINSGLHGRWITRLQKYAEVVWATTWEHAANYALAPLLGIAPLPVATSVEQVPPTQEQIDSIDIPGWKAMALDQLYPDQAVVWIDDSNEAFSGGAWQGAPHRQAGTARLALTADPEYGLADEWMDTAVEFVRAHRRPSEAGSVGNL